MNEDCKISVDKFGKSKWIVYISNIIKIKNMFRDISIVVLTMSLMKLGDLTSLTWIAILFPMIIYLGIKFIRILIESIIEVRNNLNKKE